jgi:hypothetical protein
LKQMAEEGYEGSDEEMGEDEFEEGDEELE